MKFHLAQSSGFVITHHEPGTVRINDQNWSENLILFPETGGQAWAGMPGSAEAVAAAWAPIVAYGPAIVVIGTGAKLKFPHPSLLHPLIDARIGYELMDTAAACRTYSVLLSEGRKVCAALVMAAP
jgi:uncharacterized protein